MVAERWYRVGELAKLLGVHRDTIQRWCREGKVRSSKLPGGHYRVHGPEIEALLRRFSEGDFKQAPA